MLAQPGQLWPSEDLFLNKVLLTFSPTIHLQSTPVLDWSTCPQGHRAQKPTVFTRWLFTELRPHCLGQFLRKTVFWSPCLADSPSGVGVGEQCH